MVASFNYEQLELDKSKNSPPLQDRISRFSKKGWELPSILFPRLSRGCNGRFRHIGIGNLSTRQIGGKLDLIALANPMTS